jgi:hypothetical protein
MVTIPFIRDTTGMEMHGPREDFLGTSDLARSGAMVVGVGVAAEEVIDTAARAMGTESMEARTVVGSRDIPVLRILAAAGTTDSERLNCASLEASNCNIEKSHPLDAGTLKPR